MSVANSVCVCCVYITEEQDSSKTGELSATISHVSVSKSSSRTVHELNSSVYLMNKFVEMQERSFRFMYRKYGKRTTLSGYVQQILFEIIMKYIHYEVARENLEIN